MEKLCFFVDSAGEGKAVLLADGGGQRLVIPLALLPKGTGEGDYLRASFERDGERRERAREETGRLMDGLGDNP